MRQRATARTLILASILSVAMPAIACDGEGCPGDYGQWRESQSQREERERYTRPDVNRPGYDRNEETRRRYNEGPAAFDPRRGEDSSSPSMWNQYGPNGQFQTCSRGFNGFVFCY